ncbi:MAG TPA: hypothetical protein VHH73_06990 [Verrucomicrobiae bacterium]|nr:hypothetical protein [Verrucomicrobiae bacterium]
MSLNQTQWQETLHKIYRLAAVDQAFRQRCLKDAIGVVREVSGMEVPPGLHLRFVEKIEENVFVLPPLCEDGGNLGETDLAKVAGGLVPPPPPQGNCGCGHDTSHYVTGSH